MTIRLNKSAFAARKIAGSSTSATKSDANKSGVSKIAATAAR
jgi:hypothetical protein